MTDLDLLETVIIHIIIATAVIILIIRSKE